MKAPDRINGWYRKGDFRNSWWYILSDIQNRLIPITKRLKFNDDQTVLYVREEYPQISERKVRELIFKVWREEIIENEGKGN